MKKNNNNNNSPAWIMYRVQCNAYPDIDMDMKISVWWERSLWYQFWANMFGSTQAYKHKFHSILNNLNWRILYSDNNDRCAIALREFIQLNSEFKWKTKNI